VVPQWEKLNGYDATCSQIEWCRKSEKLNGVAIRDGREVGPSLFAEVIFVDPV
jgi:hypothetical protein